MSVSHYTEHDTVEENPRAKIPENLGLADTTSLQFIFVDKNNKK